MKEENSLTGAKTMNNFKNFFAFRKEPFVQDIRVSDLYPLPGLNALVERFLYAVNLGAVSVITGEVGSGKSTSLRLSTSKLHPSGYRIIAVTAHTGSVMEFIRQISIALDMDCRSPSRALLTRTIRTMITEIASRKQVPVLVIDEAHLMRIEVLAQIHTLMQFEFDSQALMPVIMSGQNSLIDKLMYHTSRPLASRVVGRSHLEGLKLKDMQGYLKHHLEIAGIKEQLFSDEATVAIHQGSGGLLRKANNLARGALMAAAHQSSLVASAEHVRIASTEIF
jgi:general secretion pathway protein A